MNWITRKDYVARLYSQAKATPNGGHIQTLQEGRIEAWSNEALAIVFLFSHKRGDKSTVETLPSFALVTACKGNEQAKGKAVAMAKGEI